VVARFLIYGCAGLVLEVFFTGACAAIFERDPSATGHTYLWMLPIYGAAMLGLEQLSMALGGMPALGRAAVYVAAIYAVELSAGWLLKASLGRCPWDYGARGLSVKGLIRLDYAPAWYAAALLFDPFHRVVVASLAHVSLGQLWAVAGLG